MGVAACVLANEPAVLKDKLIQARIDGKTWKQIQEEFGFSSVQVARKTFRKVTGINNLNVKGKEFKHLLDNNMFDELKMAVPKTPPAPSVATATSEAATLPPPTVSNVPGSGTGLVGEHMDIMQKAFPGHTNKILLDNADEEELFSLWSGQFQAVKGKSAYTKTVEDIGQAKADQIWTAVKNGSYYSDIKNQYHVDFADIDAIFWHKTLEAGKQQSTYAKFLWDAYKKKPTSELGFKAIQDHVWNLKKMGIDPDDIAKYTGIDHKVVNMILDDTWTLPAKGSKQYVGFSSPSSGYSTPYSQTSTQLIGESSSFANMSQAQVDSWIQVLGQDMTSDQVSWWRSYSGSFYHEVNASLRSGSYVNTSSRGARAARDMKDSMRPMSQNVTLHRGVDSNAFPQGIPDIGEAYVDEGFMSTSFGDRAAFSSRSIQMHIDVPAGTPARPIYNISGFGMSEREIVLDAGTKLILTGKQQVGHQTHLYFKAVP